MNNFILNNSNSEIDFGILSFIDSIDKKEPIEFFTSGTTGEPKSITHSYETLVKNIKISDEFNDVVWGLTYDYKKMAGAQVILQSYLNGGKLVNLFNKTQLEIVELINEYQVTHISATPTFYRLLNKNIFEKVKQITLGGEPVDEFVINHIKNLFPNAKIKNIYALTEFGTLFASDTFYFEMSEKKSHFLKIENSNIFIKKDNQWMDTEDIVEFLDDKKFRIVGRSGNIINVGGYKINPIKIESIINELPYVKNSYVYGKKNSVVGNLVFADISLIDDIDKKEITNYLEKKLSRYEMPTKINFVDEVKINSTGKIVRI
jgi:acyl-coenzyme A synthetase/AMP-(fatty) acid ligase